jgi:hypothetical protein
LLQKRLNEARSVLTREAKGLFTPGTFDFASKSLISNDGKYKLQWELRRHPELPESYENQQTNRGDVVFKENNHVGKL